MEPEDELLEAGRPTLPRPARIACAVLIVAVLVAVFAIRFWPGSGPKPREAALGSAPPPVPSVTPSPSVAPPSPAWPTAHSACGGETEVPFAASRPPAGRTGLRVLLGGNELRIVDFDTGAITPLPSTAVRHGAFVASLSATTPAFGTTINCGGSGRSRIVSVAADGSVQYLGDLRPTQSILADGDRAWIATTPNSGLPFIQPLAQGPRVHLPANMYPVAIENGIVIGSRESTGDGVPGQDELLLVDAHTGRVVKTRTGVGSQVVGTGDGKVLWTSGCDLTRDRPCRLEMLSVTGDRPRQYPLPRPALVGTLSADGSRIALLLEAGNQARDDGHPFPPSHVAVLNLGTGRLDMIPGVTVPAKSFPGMAFSPDGRWLGVALDAGSYTRLLAWRPGIGKAYELADLPGPNYGAPPLVSAPARTG